MNYPGFITTICVKPLQRVVPSVSVSPYVHMIAVATLMALSAQLRIVLPVTDVPFTFQLVIVLLAGFVLAPFQAAASMGMYLIAGTMWSPLFAGPTGIVGPTGGYLLGFPIAACIVSLLRGSCDSGTIRLLAAGSIGVLIVFVLGVSWRIILLRGTDTITGGTGTILGCINAGITTGFVPFAATSIVKLLLAVSCLKTARAGLRMRYPRPVK